jgi:hypothetical protein
MLELNLKANNEAKSEYELPTNDSMLYLNEEMLKIVPTSNF